MNLLFTWWLRTQIQWSYKSTVQRLATDTQVGTDIPAMLPASQGGELNTGGTEGTQLSTATLLRTQGWSPLLKCHLAISGENLDAEHRGRSC